MPEYFPEVPEKCPHSQDFETAASVHHMNNFGEAQWTVSFQMRCRRCGVLFAFLPDSETPVRYSNKNMQVTLALAPVMPVQEQAKPPVPTSTTPSGAP